MPRRSAARMAAARSAETGPGSVGVTGILFCGSRLIFPATVARRSWWSTAAMPRPTDDHTYWNKQCGPTGFPCPPVPGNPNPHQFMTVFALTQPPVPIAAWCAGATNPMPSAAALRDEVVRLLPPAADRRLTEHRHRPGQSQDAVLDRDQPEVNLGQAKLVGFPVRAAGALPAHRVRLRRPDQRHPGAGPRHRLRPGERLRTVPGPVRPQLHPARQGHRHRSGLLASPVPRSATGPGPPSPAR